MMEGIRFFIFLVLYLCLALRSITQPGGLVAHAPNNNNNNNNNNNKLQLGCHPVAVVILYSMIKDNW
jgi:hypothetical protein